MAKLNSHAVPIAERIACYQGELGTLSWYCFYRQRLGLIDYTRVKHDNGSAKPVSVEPRPLITRVDYRLCFKLWVLRRLPSQPCGSQDQVGGSHSADRLLFFHDARCAPDFEKYVDRHASI